MPDARWPATFERGAVMAWIEDSSGQALSSDATLPDTLIVTAQALGLAPHELRMWIYDWPRPDWEHARLAEALTAWAQRHGFATAAQADGAGEGGAA